MMKKIFFIFISGFLFSANSFAQFQFESLNPSCSLKKYVGGKWENASTSELAEKNLPAPRALSGSATSVGIKYNNTWYSAPSQCFVSGQPAASSPEAQLVEDQVSNEASKKSRYSKSSDSHALPSFYFRLEGSYLLDMDSDSKAHSTTDANGTLNYSAATHPITIGGAFGYNLNEDIALELRLSKSGYKQTIALVSAGTFNLESSLLDIHLGGYYHFSRGTFSPFAGLNIGYTSSSTEITLSGFTPTTYNGVAKASGSGIGFGAVVGCDIQIAGNLAAVPTVTYKMATIKPTISSSTSTFYDAGDVLTESKIKNLLFGLGLQYSF